MVTRTALPGTQQIITWGPFRPCSRASAQEWCCFFSHSELNLHIEIIYLFIYLFYFWLRWVFVAARKLFSSCGERGLLSIAVRRLLFIVVRGLLIAVASLVAEHGL